MPLVQPTLPGHNPRGAGYSRVTATAAHFGKELCTMSLIRSFLRLLIACFFTSLFALAPQNLAAQTHVVSPSDLQQATVASTQTRMANVAKLDQLLSTPVGQKALKEARVDAT